MVDVVKSPVTDAQVVLTDRYREARTVWRTRADVRTAARLARQFEREYCDRYVQRNFGSHTKAQVLPSGLDVERAFREAGVQRVVLGSRDSCV